MYKNILFVALSLTLFVYIHTCLCKKNLFPWLSISSLVKVRPIGISSTIMILPLNDRQPY